MSVRFDASGEYLYRTASVPAFGDFSLTFWIYWVSLPGDATSPAFVGENSGGTSFYTGTNGSNQPIVGDPDFQEDNYTTAYSASTWYRVAMVFDNTADTVTLYGGDDDETSNLTQWAQEAYTGSITNSEIRFNANGLQGGASADIRIGNIKLFDAVLTTTELKDELAYFDIQDSTDIWGAWDCKSHTDLSDNSGNSRPLSSNGTISTEADPPINDSPAVAAGRSLTLLGVG